MEIIKTIWLIWLGVVTFIFFLSLWMEVSAIKDKINGANGFIWTMIHIPIIGITAILLFISLFFFDMKTAFLYLFLSVLYFIIEIKIAKFLFTYYLKK